MATPPTTTTALGNTDHEDRAQCIPSLSSYFTTMPHTSRMTEASLVSRILSITLAILLMSGCAVEPIRPAAIDEAFLGLVTQVTKHFQRGTERVSCKRLKEFIVDFAGEYEHFALAKRSKDDTEIEGSKKLFAAVERFFRYLDSHRLEPEDLIEIREWLAASLDGSAGDANPKTSNAIVFQVSHAIGASGWTWEPHHIMLFTLIGQPGASLPLAGEWVVKIPPGSSEETRFPNWRRTKDFLAAPENKMLWSVFFDVCTSFSAARQTHAEGCTFKCGKSVENLALSCDAPVEFKKELAEFMRLSKKTFTTERLPDFALLERYVDVCFLRDGWNLVHLYGDEADKRDYREHVVLLRDFYAQRDDNVTKEWLNQVMRDPEEPFWLKEMTRHQKDRH